VARIRAVIDFDVAGLQSSPEADMAQSIILNECQNMLHKLIRPENVEHNKMYFATVTIERKSDRSLFTLNDPEEDSSSDLVEYNLP